MSMLATAMILLSHHSLPEKTCWGPEYAGCNCSKMPLWMCDLESCIIPVQKGMGTPVFNSLYLSDCELSGTIPQEIEQLELKALDLSGNQLTGKLPDYLAETAATIPQILYACPHNP